MSVRPYKKSNGDEVPGVWKIDFRPEGSAGPHRKLKYPEEGTCTRAEALAFEQECRRLSITKTARRNVNPAIRDIIPEYLEWHSLHRAPRTHKDLLYSLKNILEVFGPLPVSRITPGDITKFQLKRREHPRAVNKDLHYLGAIITWMVKNNRANELPFKIEHLPYTRPIPRPPSADDVGKFLTEVHGDDKRAICLLMFKSGLRWNEVARLTWQNVDLGEGVAVVMGKGSKERVALLPPEVVEILAPIRQHEGWVFPNPATGAPYGSLKTLFKSACRRAGIKGFTPHKLRHRAATDTLAACGDLRLVQSMLGHADIQTTTIYTHVDVGRLRDVAEKVESHRAKKNGQ